MLACQISFVETLPGLASWGMGDSELVVVDCVL